MTPPRRPMPTVVKVTVRGKIQPARLIRKPKPVYPESLKGSGIYGKVVVRLVLLKDGKPRDVSPEEWPHPLLADSAREAVSQWRWTPAILNGVPVDIVMTVEVPFNPAPKPRRR